MHVCLRVDLVFALLLAIQWLIFFVGCASEKAKNYSVKWVS